MAETIDNGEPEDRPIFSNETFGKNGPENRKEIYRRDKQGEVLSCFGRAHLIGCAGTRDQILSHEHDEDGPHPIKRKSLRGLVPDDKRNARRHRGDVWWRGRV